MNPPEVAWRHSCKENPVDLESARLYFSLINRNAKYIQYPCRNILIASCVSSFFLFVLVAFTNLNYNNTGKSEFSWQKCKRVLPSADWTLAELTHRYWTASRCCSGHTSNETNKPPKQTQTGIFGYLDQSESFLTQTQVGYVPLLDPEYTQLRKHSRRKRKIHSTSKPCTAIMANCLLPHSLSHWFCCLTLGTKQASCVPWVG